MENHLPKIKNIFFCLWIQDLNSERKSKDKKREKLPKITGKSSLAMALNNNILYVQGQHFSIKVQG